MESAMPFAIPPTGAVAVIFLSIRNGDDADGYAIAARRMEEAAAAMPGFIGFIAARGSDGVGIAVSYWADEATAQAWRDQPDHAHVRDQGRAVWYDRYSVSIAEVTRAYHWDRHSA
jgi:heme-degrading monooxygenase HmoA